MATMKRTLDRFVCRERTQRKRKGQRVAELPMTRPAEFAFPYRRASGPRAHSIPFVYLSMLLVYLAVSVAWAGGPWAGVVQLPRPKVYPCQVVRSHVLCLVDRDQGIGPFNIDSWVEADRSCPRGMMWRLRYDTVVQTQVALAPYGDPQLVLPNAVVIAIVRYSPHQVASCL